MHRRPKRCKGCTCHSFGGHRSVLVEGPENRGDDWRHRLDPLLIYWKSCYGGPDFFRVGQIQQHVICYSGVDQLVICGVHTFHLILMPWMLYDTLLMWCFTSESDLLLCHVDHKLSCFFPSAQFLIIHHYDFSCPNTLFFRTLKIMHLFSIETVHQAGSSFAWLVDFNLLWHAMNKSGFTCCFIISSLPFYFYFGFLNEGLFCKHSYLCAPTRSDWLFGQASPKYTCVVGAS